jgi:hypothetical protein
MRGLSHVEGFIRPPRSTVTGRADAYRVQSSSLRTSGKEIVTRFVQCIARRIPLMAAYQPGQVQDARMGRIALASRDAARVVIMGESRSGYKFPYMLSNSS